MMSGTLDEMNRGILIFLSMIHFWSLLRRVRALHAGCSCLGQEVGPFRAHTVFFLIAYSFSVLLIDRWSEASRLVLH